ncbi:hypothetical protein B0A52_08493 [Exophiala mesophila]|uniref:Uncharacterized protein n=1 Tax=Exophiala mesophila TaxID=212818 RepID=A0A438MVW1_EXOME|nr:hypothetical protein B0A52_08493 [Exophiala mesophila]
MESDKSSTIENLRKEILDLKKKLRSCPPVDTHVSAQNSPNAASPIITPKSATPGSTPSSVTPSDSSYGTSLISTNSTATSLSLIESNTPYTSGRTDLLISVADRFLDLCSRLDELLDERQTMSKIGGGLPACLMGSYHADGSGQDLKGFVRNSLALRENRIELESCQEQYHQHKFRVAENRLRLAVNRIALMFDRLIGTCNRIPLEAQEDEFWANRQNIHGVVSNILSDAFLTVADHSWTRLYLKGLLAFYRDEATQQFRVQTPLPAMSAPVQHLHELLSRASTRNRDSPNTNQRTSPQNPISRREDGARDSKYCPACHPSTRFDILKFDTELKHTKWKRKCRLCHKFIECDFVRETVISLAVRRK